MKRTIKIDGMHCKSCKSLIEGELLFMECVKCAVVSLEEGRVEVTFNEDCIDDVVGTIEDLGFIAEVQE